MSTIITSQIDRIRDEVKSLKSSDISDERAFIHLILTIFYKQKIADHIVTDGKNDGGIDFIYYNEEENKLILGQSKYTENLDFNDVVAEYNKMHSTYCNFKKGITGIYNADIKRELQNGIDQLPEDNSGSVEYCLFTIANLNTEDILTKMGSKMTDFPVDSAKIYNQESIEKAIEADQSSIEIVANAKIKIDKATNFLEYESVDLKGIMCNVLSSSIVYLYNRYQNSGLFDLNIRRFVPNKLVDSGIRHTLDHERDNFWFLNNGIIIACEDFEIDGNTINLTNFSIVNGGQTTQLIGEYKGPKQTEVFNIPCKIVAVKNKKRAHDSFNKIAEASNSQKPIFPRDLRSNSKEMVSLKKWLADEKINLEIKRGTKKPKAGKFKYTIKNDELGQFILSFVFQQPGTSRSGKKTIFENTDIYGKLYRENYQKTIEKKQFLLDIIDLNARYEDLENAYKDKEDSSHILNEEQSEILKNGKQTIFALMGLCYMLVNGYITNEQVLADQHYAEKFEYGPILSNYKKDDLDYKFNKIFYSIISILTDLYSLSFKNKTVTSVSNFMKTDARYYSDIVKKFISYFNFAPGETIMANWDIFKR